MKKYKIIAGLSIFAIVLFVGCAAKPSLMPVNISQGNIINVDGSIYVEIIDNHRPVKKKGVSQGKIRDVHERDITPSPYVSNYLKSNIISSLDLATNGRITTDLNKANYKLVLNIEHLDYYRNYSFGTALASQLTIGSLIAKDSYTAEFIATLAIIDGSNGNYICNQKISQQVDHEHKLRKYYRGVEELLSIMSYKVVQEVLKNVSICFN